MGAPLKECRAQQSADTVLASSRIPTAGFSPRHSVATLPVLPRCRGMNSRDPFDARLLKALGHPLRLRIVEALTQKSEASPIALAREFTQPLATVSHHVRMLRDLGWVELVRTEPRRGAAEHVYRAATRPFIDDSQWLELPLVMRRGLARQTFCRIFAEASLAGADGGFDDAGAHIDRMPLELDEQGRREVSDVLTGVLEQVHEIQQRADARRATQAGRDGDLTATSMALLHFRVSDRPAPRAPANGPRRKRLRRPELR